MNYYAVTLRKTRPVKTLKQATNVVKTLTYYIKRAKIDYPNADIRFHWECVETDGTYNIHVHGLIKSPANIINFRTDKGYHSHVTPCTNQAAWNVYITKSDDTPERILHRISHPTKEAGPASVGRLAEPLEIREHTQFMNKVRVVNLFDMHQRYLHNKTQKWLKKKSR
jgi:hypothetical protein